MTQAVMGSVFLKSSSKSCCKFKWSVDNTEQTGKPDEALAVMTLHLGLHRRGVRTVKRKSALTSGPGHVSGRLLAGSRWQTETGH